ncbi:surface antigen-like protein [Leishmania mexicana MHOM/GT/2001/U1103]|uniref:Surface antigen-like protein n=1 Tax=Leishmania mexicana (strain MHOM/GT/2001/U1103) TaxID=929439 RepID=E9AK03_LEIMU|nr:surface antigen-like protein [Leishmania mexicana MHOM/GT/2001/U1103]CBZ23253.1 surface antigen-like protein [Leishmania mexicana MHOM/GT/2001/U1103]
MLTERVPVRGSASVHEHAHASSHSLAFHRQPYPPSPEHYLTHPQHGHRRTSFLFPSTRIMPVFALRSSHHKRGIAAVLLLAIVVAVTLTVSAQTIDNYPPVPCDSTVPNCLECRKMGMLSLCSNCKEGYSTAVSPATPTEFGKCKPYNPSTCRLGNCLRCAADDNTKCVQCPVGYPNINTYLCDATTAAPTTASPSITTTTTSPTTAAPSITTTTTSPTTAAPSITTTTASPTTAAPSITTTTTSPTTSAPSTGCQTPSCAICVPGSQYTCAVCESGMVLMVSGQCMPAGSCSMANCAQCYPNDNNRCSSCESGYALTVSYTCIPRKPGNSAAAPTPVLVALAIVSVAATVTYVI